MRVSFFKNLCEYRFCASIDFVRVSICASINFVLKLASLCAQNLASLESGLIPASFRCQIPASLGQILRVLLVFQIPASLVSEVCEFCTF